MGCKSSKEEEGNSNAIKSDMAETKIPSFDEVKAIII